MNPKTCECGKRGICRDSRQEENYVRRRYHCACGKRWTTFEAREEYVDEEKKES